MIGAIIILEVFQEKYASKPPARGREYDNAD
jgi:hypothetical protein